MVPHASLISVGSPSSPCQETSVPTKQAVRSATIVFFVANDNTIAIIAGRSDIQPIVSNSMISPPLIIYHGDNKSKYYAKNPSQFLSLEKSAF